MKFNLEKAVEKAKKKKSSTSKVYPLSNGNTATNERVSTSGAAESKSPTAKPAGPKWVAPEYSRTRRIDFDEEKIKDNRCVSLMTDSAKTRLYEMLRTRIQLAAGERNLRTIMITSAESGDGKTLTSINLACSFAKAHHQTVLLVDADLKKLQIHQYLGIQSPYGLIDYLVGERTMEECLVWPGIDKMLLLSGGRTLQGSSELLSSPIMKSFVKEVRNRYEDRFVFFDAPPVLAGADTMSLAQMVDGIVLVAETGKTSKEHFKKAVDLLPREKLIGVVMNREAVAEGKAYYKYY